MKKLEDLLFQRSKPDAELGRDGIDTSLSRTKDVESVTKTR